MGARSSPNKIRPLATGKGVIWIAVMISLTLTHVPTSSLDSWATKSNTKFWPGGSLAGLTHGSTQIDPNYGFHVILVLCNPLIFCTLR
jgi:hypothetical protein